MTRVRRKELKKRNKHTDRATVILITTSRRPTNRIRTFTQDLYSVLPMSERFNRGGMSLNELIARIRSSHANAAFIVTHYKGNPGKIRVYLPSGEEKFCLWIESAVLRRDVLANSRPRIQAINSITFPSNSSEETIRFANELATLLGMESYNSDELPLPQKGGSDKVNIRIQDHPRNRILWTHYHAESGIEIGPRIRITKIRWYPTSDSRDDSRRDSS